MASAIEESAIPTVGMQFQSFSEIEKFINNYGESIQEHFVRRRSSRLTAAYVKDNNESLIYYNIQYCCKYGGREYVNQSKGQRKTSSCKVNCPAFISFYISKDRKCLEIRRAELSLERHENSKAVYKFLPEKRRLAPEEREVAIQHLQLQCDKKLLRRKLEDDYGKSVTMKDLTNINSKLRRDGGLAKMAQHLENKES